jgi:hemolysin activation/secretion protein
MKKIKKNTPKSKIGFIGSVCISALLLESANAQTGLSAADALRNIEQNKIDLSRSTLKTTDKQVNAPASMDQGFANLKEVRVESPLFQQELMAYWRDEITKPVPAERINAFKAFAWNLFQSKGYLAYITTSTASTHEGTVLTVTASIPTVGKIFVLTAKGSKGKEFADEVARRFKTIYKTGAPIDIQGIENQLNAAAYDLPVDLEVSMRQTNSTTVDVVIHLRPIETEAGKLLNGFVQANNYGLDQFGREQLLGNVRIAGITPLSELALFTQQSKGVGYYRADYEAPLVSTGVRWKVYGSEVRSQSSTNSGFSQELGASFTKLLSTNRTGRWLSSAEISRRQTQNRTSDVMTANRVDQQFRLKVRTEALKGWVDNFNNEWVLTAGYIDLDRFANDKAFDASTLKVAGTYQKLEMNGSLSKILDKDGVYTGSIRWRAQAATKNLDSYNKISLGGMNGMRSYSSIDGVGDQGAILSFDVIHQVLPDVWGGFFYDIGAVKTDRKPLASATDSNAYLLQGAGLQFGGAVHQFQWTLSMALALGKNPSAWTAVNTQAGDMRLNFAVARPF